MVEEYLEAKQKYRVWLLEYHREAEFCSPNRVLEPGHFFQGRFSIGGQHKNRGNAYLQSFKTLLQGEYVTTEEPKEIRVHADALHTNSKNGRCFEVYHEYLGYVRDTKNLLKMVDDSTYVRISPKDCHMRRRMEHVYGKLLRCCNSDQRMDLVRQICFGCL